MDKFHSILIYLSAHWEVILLAIGGAMSLLGTVRNVVSRTKWAKKDQVDHWIDDLLDALAFVARNGQKGIAGALSIPFLPSQPKAVAAPAPQVQK